MIARFGFSVTYLIDVLTFVVLTSGSLVPFDTSPRRWPAPVPAFKAIIEGLKYARSRPELIGTYIVDIVAMTFAMPMALFPAMTMNWGGAAAVGWLYSAMSIGEPSDVVAERLDVTN